MQDADPIAAPVGEQADDTVRWGLGDAVVGWLLAQVAAIIATSIVIGATGDEFDELSIVALAPIQLALWVPMLGVPYLATRLKGNGIVHDLGLRFRPADASYALVGVACQYLLILVYLPIFWLTDIDTEDLSGPARDMTDRADGALGVILLTLLVGIAAPIVEEVFYRGLVQRAMARRIGGWPAVFVTALIFGVVHFQLLQFPSLALFGVVLGVLAHRYGRLGPPIAAHMGFNLITVAALVAT